MESQEQFQQSSLAVALRSEDTAKSIPVNLIISIIKDDNYYEAFTNNFENNRHIFGNTQQATYTKAIQQFKEAIEKNNYDFQLTEQHYQRISHIIENYGQIKNNLKDIVDANPNYKYEVREGVTIYLSTLFQYLTDYRILHKVFNSVDRDEKVYQVYYAKDLIHGFGLLFREIEMRWGEINLDDNDPNLYRLMSIVNAFSHCIEDPTCKFYLPEQGIAELQQHLDIPYLSMLLSAKTVPLDIKKRYLTSVSPATLNSLYTKMELGEKNRLARELGIWPVDETMQKRMDTINEYIQSGLIANLKKVFNGYVKEEEYHQLLHIHLFCTNEGLAYRHNESSHTLATNDGNNTTIDIESPYTENYEFPEAILTDAITHEAVHNLSKTTKGAGFKVEKKYRGLNEAITQYLAETALGDKAYAKLTGKSYCGYGRSVTVIEKLVNMGIFTVEELAYNYVNNNVEYLQKSITAYTDINTYNEIIENFNIINFSEDKKLRKTSLNRLDTILVELREKSKTNTQAHKRS